MPTNYSTYEVRTRAVEAVRRGMGMSTVAAAYSADRSTIFRWVRRYEEGGNQALLRKPVSGRPRKLEGLGEEDFRRLVLTPPSHYGYETDLWTAARLRAVLQQEHEIVVCRDTVWRRLREAGLTYQKPERVYYELDEEARQEWARREIPRIRRTVRKHRAILYFQDEANVSLTAFLGKTWGLRGHTPKATVTGKRGGLAAMSAITKLGHLLFRLYEKRIKSGEVIQFLAQMLAHHKRRHLVVVMDQAPPHTSKMTKAYVDSQSRLHVFYLPKYSPAWNPDEKVWNHLKHHELAAHQAKTKRELKVLAKRKLHRMARNPSLIRGLFFRCCVAELFG